MSHRPDGHPDSEQPMVYEIKITGHLEPRWASCFDGLTITLEPSGETLLTGPVIDQSALFGLIRTIRDSGLQLLSVTRTGSADTDVLQP